MFSVNYPVSNHLFNLSGPHGDPEFFRLVQQVSINLESQRKLPAPVVLVGVTASFSLGWSMMTHWPMLALIFSLAGLGVVAASAAEVYLGRASSSVEATIDHLCGQYPEFSSLVRAECGATRPIRLVSALRLVRSIRRARVSQQH